MQKGISVYWSHHTQLNKITKKMEQEETKKNDEREPNFLDFSMKDVFDESLLDFRMDI